jgi:putative membrane-bound dehydrogenase-like protein
MVSSFAGLAQQDVKSKWMTPIDPRVKKLPLDWPAMSPTESQKTIQLPDGYVAELVAAEPLVVDPVAINWGPDGRIWVVEMADYPLGMDGRGSPGSRVRFLEDTNGDGAMDSSTVFIEGLTFANSVTPWRNGVIITCAPEIIYAEDTNGDGKADYRKTLYDGFMEGNPQLRINGLRYGIDNWLYCANGLQTRGKVRSVETEETIEMAGRDFRIRPDEGRIEELSGPTEYARVMDDAGNWYGNDNSNPLWHFALEDRYMRRNRHAAPPDARVQLMPPRNPPIYPISKLQMRFNVDYMANKITSACGPGIYRDDLLFGRDTKGVVQGFACEPVHNMLLRIVAEPVGSTYKGRRAKGEEESEFLAATDAWFRPVMVRTGMDGALWVVDMYRYTVEHPQYMNEEWRSKIQLRAGDDLGRLYRVYHKDRPPRPTPRLDRMNTRQLVDALNNTSGTVRDLAQQMLVWRAETAAVAPLENLLKSGEDWRGRLHALGALAGLNQLSAATLKRAMQDDSPAVRRFALKFAEPRGANEPELIQAATRLAGDPDAKVRLQLACTLGEWEGDPAGAALARIAERDSDDVYIAAAVTSSTLKHYGAIAQTVLRSRDESSSGMFNNLLTMAAAQKDAVGAVPLLERVLADTGGRYASWQFDAYAGWLESAARNKINAKPKDAPSADPLFAEARRVAADGAATAEHRSAAARLLAHDRSNREASVAILIGMFNPQTPTEAQLAAVTVLSRMSGIDPHETFLKDWAQHGPQVRAAMAGRLLSGTDRTLKTLRMIESGELVGFDVDFMARRRLFRSANKEIKALAQIVFADVDDRPREALVQEWSDALKLPTDEARGAEVFETACAVCHRVNGVGQHVGPDLRSVTDRSKAGLLAAIIDPNRAVEPRYTAYAVALRNGDAAYGVMTAETGASVTMIGADGTSRTFLRSEIQSLQSTNLSLMPEGLETALTRQQMADLIAYLGYPEETGGLEDNE